MEQHIIYTLAALLTICVFSFLWKDNPLYKFAEHLVVGVSAGYFARLSAAMSQGASFISQK